MLNTIIVDDEPLAHEVLLHHLSAHKDINIIGQYLNAKDALCALATSSIDLLFLDINMPEISGIALLKVLANRPQVVIISAYQEYALAGFELDVTDYLLKPVSAQRLDRALNKVRQNRKLITLNSNAPLTITLKIDREKHKIHLSEIDMFEAYGNYVKVWQGEKALLASSTLKYIAQELDTSFIQVHKSYVINKHKVVTLSNESIQLSSGVSVKIGRSYKQLVRDII
ncbi:LytTR family DNA-binding domain-containing protein [Pseudoalteromonas sp. 2CM41L]|uniref:LytR/AlgR family response regulator transcription factor n=1 Tax=Pseudoalteromonas sp. 2CM41L TaxID=2929857 RepID=UPI0020C17AE4|nr:LytTR family DNA-binding domain-containing protein [Pseudoalteromonas sp. 2CM41L]MCK8105848.1 LytTR family DNA-binding domain-containing protein [Pseudoalteromonas sp. 2CM41L]